LQIFDFTNLPIGWAQWKQDPRAADVIVHNHTQMGVVLHLVSRGSRGTEDFDLPTGHVCDGMFHAWHVPPSIHKKMIISAVAIISSDIILISVAIIAILQSNRDLFVCASVIQSRNTVVENPTLVLRGVRNRRVPVKNNPAAVIVSEYAEPIPILRTVVVELITFNGSIATVPAHYSTIPAVFTDIVFKRAPLTRDA
jgi:hypothetical protein